ncbi:MFS transporter [Rubrivivax albus]|uniref:MFS transporter n=1 Tax=Rubrivivax albus TaxID=2499835 RepID=UPI001E5D0CB5|nr:MFS transporter [Rubrivivax albus]
MSAAPASLGAFSAVWFCYFAAIGLYNPYAPLWFKELGYSTLAIGAIASAISWTRVVAPYGWGWFGDRSGQRSRGVRWAAGLSVAAAGGLWLWPDPAALPVFAVLLFLANGGVVPLSEAALSQQLQRGGLLDYARYGRVRLWGSLGFVVSVAAAGAVFERWGIRHFAMLVLAAFVLLWWATLRLPEAAAVNADDTPAPPVRSVLRRPAVAWFFGGVSLTVLAHTALYAFFSLYLNEQGHGSGVVGLAWGVAVGVEIVFFWAQGRIFDRLSPIGWLQLAAVVAALRFALTAAFGGSLALLLLAQTLHAVSFAAQHAACIAMVHRFFPGRLRGRGQALYSVLGYGLPGVLGGVAGGWIGERFGFTAVFWAAAGVAMLAWAALRRAERALAQEPTAS